MTRRNPFRVVPSVPSRVAEPSSTATRRLSADLRREVGDLRVLAEESLLRSEMYAELGHADAAAAVMAEHRALLDGFSSRMQSALAAAAVEREAESILDGLGSASIAEDPNESIAVLPRSRSRGATKLQTALTAFAAAAAAAAGIVGVGLGGGAPSGVSVAGQAALPQSQEAARIMRELDAALVEELPADDQASKAPLASGPISPLLAEFNRLSALRGPVVAPEAPDDATSDPEDGDVADVLGLLEGGSVMSDVEQTVAAVTDALDGDPGTSEDVTTATSESVGNSQAASQDGASAASTPASPAVAPADGRLAH